MARSKTNNSKKTAAGPARPAPDPQAMRRNREARAFLTDVMAGLSDFVLE